VGDRLRALVGSSVEPQMRSLREEIAVLAERISELRASEGRIAERLDRVHEIVAAQRDEIAWHRRKLTMVRETPEYAVLWTDREPLVSVRIATWNRAETLVERAIASVLRQTYQRFEIVVVGDGCTDDTESRIRKLGDERIRFHNLPFRNVYPDDPGQRWLVAGGPVANAAVSMARGSWLAPLDDDDEFVDDHLEVLLPPALDGRYELFYGRFQGNWPGVDDDVLGAYPPRLGQVTLQAAIYPRLLSFFEFDPRSWLLDEPGDWNLVRRMIESGVRIGFTDRVVTRLVPSGPDSPPPESGGQVDSPRA
jgi:hypothetical protein